MNICKIKIKNYKSIKDSGEIKIDNKIMGFIGQNNAGKSAILDAIQCVFPLAKKVVSRSDFHKGTHENIEITIWFTGVTDKYLEDKMFLDSILKLTKKAEDLQKKDEDKDKIEKAWKNVEETREKNLRK